MDELYSAIVHTLFALRLYSRIKGLQCLYNTTDKKGPPVQILRAKISSDT